MNNQKLINKYEIAECVGLWLAEGDKRCNNEINFSNNCFNLIKQFHKIITSLFKKYKFNIRIYIYTKYGEKIDIPIKKCKINIYIDKQATRPYFIWRLASVELNKKWKKIVKEIRGNKKYYADFLRGFFAGEGNIKTGSHNNRTIRISQGKPLELIESILKHFKIDYKYSPRERSYVITGKVNWDRCAEIKIADLHPLRKLKFWRTYKDFKEEHYKHNYLDNSIFDSLINPLTSYELSIKFNRSQARIYDVLDILKKKGKILNYRVRSKDYWIRKDQNIIILSKLKQNYINFLKHRNKSTKEFSGYFSVDWKSSFRRLKELEKLGLVKRDRNKKWRRLNTNKKVIAL